MTEQEHNRLTETFPNLRVVIVQNDKTVKVIELPDPREAWIRNFNDQSWQWGLEAIVSN